jgi:hypothetical protein
MAPMLRLFNAASGALEPIPSGFAGPVAVRCGASTADGLRRTIILSAAGPILDVLGYRFALDGGPGSPLTLELGKTRGPKDLAATPALRWLFLNTHYRAPLEITPESLEAAGLELAHLADRANQMEAARVSGAANPSALAGYKARLREALSQDLGIPQGLRCVWDALRPGALSGPTQKEILREADRLFGLRLLD